MRSLEHKWNVRKGKVPRLGKLWPHTSPTRAIYHTISLHLYAYVTSLGKVHAPNRWTAISAPTIAPLLQFLDAIVDIAAADNLRPEYLPTKSIDWLAKSLPRSRRPVIARSWQ